AVLLQRLQPGAAALRFRVLEPRPPVGLDRGVRVLLRQLGRAGLLLAPGVRLHALSWTLRRDPPLAPDRSGPSVDGPLAQPRRGVHRPARGAAPFPRRPPGRAARPP